MISLNEDKQNKTLESVCIESKENLKKVYSAQK